MAMPETASQVELPRKSMSRLRLTLYLGTGGLVFVLGAEACRVVLGFNFHTVVAGQVYRGAQPGAAELNTIIPRYHIQTVINLRAIAILRTGIGKNAGQHK